MTLYRLDVLDEDKKVQGTAISKEGVDFDYNSVNLGNVLIMLMNEKTSVDLAENIRNHVQGALRRAHENDKIEVVIIGTDNPDSIKFFRITPIDLSPPKKKSLHSRKIRRKFDSTDTKKEDAKVIQEDEEEEEVQEKEASRGGKEKTTGGIWPF